jgi:hypothetical protein
METAYQLPSAVGEIPRMTPHLPLIALFCCAFELTLTALNRSMLL